LRIDGGAERFQGPYCTGAGGWLPVAGCR
jgi:hypothetical protein